MNAGMNATDKQQRVKGGNLFLDGYIAKGESIHKSFRGKEYEIELFQGKHEEEYCVYELKNGVRDGCAELIDNGIVKMRWRMKKELREGKYILFDEGVVAKEGRWKDIGTNEERWIENRNGRTRMFIRMNKTLTYNGGFNDDLERDGYGIEYKNGMIKRCGRFKNDKLVSLKYRFLQKKMMIEYEEDTTYDLLSYRPVYIGSYIIDEDSGIAKRHGKGRVLNKWTGVGEYESEWTNGVETEAKRKILNDGWYCEHDVGESMREVVNGLSPVMAGDQILLRRTSVCEKLTIANNNCNQEKATELKVDNLPYLKTVTIGNDCFGNVQVVELNGLESLQAITIGTNSFTLSKNCGEGKSIKIQTNSHFLITNCPKLVSITVGDYSFSGYVTFQVSSLPSLQYMQTGVSCFYVAQGFALKSWE